MNDTYVLGVAVGVLIAIVLLLLLKVFGKYNEGQKYDERQIREQGRANMIAYRFTLLGLAALLIADTFSERFSYNIMPLCIIAIICISILIFAIYCITHDAYYGIDKLINKKYVIIWIAVIITNLASLVANIMAKGIITDGHVNTTVMANAMIIILFAGILIATLIHSSRRDKAEE